MKVSVLQEFRDKDDFSKVYKPGEAVSFATSRAKEPGKRKLVDLLELSGEVPNDPDKPGRGRKGTINV